MKSAESASVKPTSQPVDIATHTTIHVNGVTAGGLCCCAIALAKRLLLQPLQQPAVDAQVTYDVMNV
jgi:hypothetical protein